MTPLLIVGAGHMGGALIAGWRSNGPVGVADLIIFDPNPGDAARAAAAAGASLNPGEASLGRARTVVVALKPQAWRDAVGKLVPHLTSEALIISIMAGVSAVDLAAEFGQRPVARVMPNIAAAIGKGVAAVYAPNKHARRVVHALFEPIATVIDLPDEASMHAVTAVAGSGPAYLFAFTEALAAAAAAAGLSAETSARLARATVVGAAAVMSATEAPPAELLRQVTSPGGTTEAAMAALMGEEGLAPLVKRAVALAVARSEGLGGG